MQIEVSKGSKTIQTYAFLDPGSTSTFCTENMIQRLNTTGRKTTVLLQTMGQKKPVDRSHPKSYYILQTASRPTNPVMPPGLFVKEDLYSRRKWRQVQYLADLFRKRWVREYLPTMQQRNKWNKIRRNFLPGDLVVIVDDSAPRNSWVLGRILKTLPGSKGLVRSVLVQTKTSVLRRPVNKLCLLLEAGD